jgi:CubicO group peptidase (beta-lactamase class C family)
MFLLTIIIFTSQVATAQNNHHLTPGQKVSAELGPEQHHTYQVKLKKGQTSLIEINQLGVDIVAFTFDSNGMPFERFDSKNGSQGVEYLTIKAKRSGTHQLEIFPIKGSDISGNYKINYRSVHDASDALETQIDQLFLTISDQTPGVAMAVLKDGKEVYKKAFGMANLEYNIPLKPTSVFHVVSVTKQFTTLAILLLEAEGKLSIDDEVHTYIPELPDYGYHITLKQLASHTSGIKGDVTMWSTAFWPGRNINKDVLLNLVLAQKELNFKPGDELSYSNGGYTLLAEVIERVSGQDFDQFIKDRILKPLDMQQSNIITNAETIIPGRAVGYKERPGGFGQMNGWVEFEGSAGLHTSVNDLIKYCTNFDDPKVGSRAIFEKMDTPVNLNDGSSTENGLGQFIKTYRGRSIIEHGGMWDGIRTVIVRVPDEDLCIIMLSNYPDKFDVHFPLFSAKVLDIFLGEEEKTSETKFDSLKVIDLSKEILETFAGNYQVNQYMKGSVIMDYNRMQFDPSAGMTAVLVPVAENKLADIEGQTIFEFEYPNDGASSYMIFHSVDGRTMTANRDEPVQGNLESKNDFEGRYFSEELEVFITIKKVDGKWMYHHITGEYQLMEIDTDVFRAEYPFQQVHFQRDQEDKITSLTVTRNNQRVRNQLFKKIE